MLRYTLKRLLSMIPTLFIVSLLIFFIIRLVPGDPARVMLGDSAPEEKVMALQEELGLNEPVYKQYFVWITKALEGDMGNSIIQRRPVVEVIGDRVECNLILGILSSIIIIIISIPVGIISAVKANTWTDQIVSSIAMFFAAVPTFWLGLTLMLLFAVALPFFPSSGFTSVIGTGDISNIRYLILPAITVGIPNTALVIRMIRSGMLDLMKEDYVRTARSKGLSNSEINIKHVFRNSLISVVSSFGFIFAALISGSVITENVFALPGLGKLLTDSILLRDYPTVQGVALLLALVFMGINLLVDISYAKIDPRVRYSD